MVKFGTLCWAFALALTSASASAQTCGAEGGIESGPYSPSEASLARHNEAPEWFRDAKLGIYTHWGVYSVPAFGSEWYPRWIWHSNITDRGGVNRMYQHHLDTYGGPEKTPYHAFVPQFTATKFNADEWADLFQKAGARFAGPVAEHHDGFAMWDSDVTPWNAADKGPKRDVAGELATALRARGMKFMGSFHHARNLQRYRGQSLEAARATGERNRRGVLQLYQKSHYPWIEGTAVTSDDPELRLLYGNVPEEEWLRDVWLAKVKEFAAKYDPDLLWFDSWLDDIPENYLNCFGADYLNHAAAKGQEVVVTRKQADLPLSWSIEDYEKGRLDRLTENAWLTDDTISLGSWSHTQDLRIKPQNRVLHDFIDIVSKNGQLLLNVSPRADGSIPDDQREVLLGLGGWLKRNGEAIYETRPWVTYGEGPSDMADTGHFTKEVQYTAQDLRFTTRGNDVLYVIALGRPEGALSVHSLGRRLKLYPDAIDSVELLGSGPVEGWIRADDALHIPVSAALPDDIAFVWKITRQAATDPRSANP